MATESQKKATKKYNKAHYDFIKVRFNKGQADKVRKRADAEGKSINQYCVEKILGDE